MEAFWEGVTTNYLWGNFMDTKCSNCKKAPLQRQEQEVLSPYCPWCGCKMTNAEEE